MNELHQTIYLSSRYASQSLSEIPLGYWIDKSVGGCGLSYLALTDRNDSIILMPRNKLIENKMSQRDKYPGLFAVNVGVGKSDVERYFGRMREESRPVKILATYDSFALGKLDYILERKDCRIYVDESQFLLDFALSQANLVNELHKRLESNVERVTFFSAHPPKREYLPEYIQKMPSIKYIWENQVKATPYIVNTNKPYMLATKILSELLLNGECTIGNLSFRKAIVFLNSVDGLKKIVEPLNRRKDIAYVVGDTVRNDSKLNDFAFPLSDCTKLPKITVGTTSLISGFDLYDEETLNIIISTSSKEFTLMDKELDVPQAITRQRLDSNPNNNKFIFILDVNNMNEKIRSLEETYLKDLKKINTVVENLNYLKEGNKDTTVGYELYEGYYFLSEERFHANESLLKARKYIFEQLYNQYQNGYNVIATNSPAEVYRVEGGFFKAKQYKEYASELKEESNLGKRKALLDTVENEDWKQYLSYGMEKDNILVNVQQARLFYESRNDYKGILLAVHKMYKPNKFYSNSEVKAQLQKLYDTKGLSRKAKSTDLYEFFEIESKSKRDGNKLIQGVVVKSRK